MALLNGKKVVVIGDRDGIPGPAIAQCAESAGGEIVFSSTECFVWTAAGAMDLENQVIFMMYTGIGGGITTLFWLI